MSSFAWKALKPLLFALDPESAHGLALAAARTGLGALAAGPSVHAPWTLAAWNLTFRNRVGLAAGFDKNAEWLPLLPSLGFGFVEIGTVTPKPQGGNPRPRLFRDPAREALFNCMGFNNLGAAVVAQRVRNARAHLPVDFRVGINIGKNRATAAQDAPQDYVAAVSPFEGLVDFVVINVSSPNTPGLRALQAQESLAPIVKAVVERVSAWKHSVPVCVKLSPEFPSALAVGEAPKFFSELEKDGISGWVLTNTLASTREESGKSLSGGLSGKPLADLSRTFLVRARTENWTRKPIVSVGGIASESEATARIASGADLIEVYSGWIFEGPRLPSRLGRAIRDLTP